jgi:alpha-acetolactate decarboxylase
MSQNDDIDPRLLFDDDHIINLPFPGGVKRVPTGPEDWGDEETVGVFVKQKGKGLSGWSGRWLGIIDGKPTIGVHFKGWETVNELVQYDTVEEMKKEWWLD